MSDASHDKSQGGEGHTPEPLRDATPKTQPRSPRAPRPTVAGAPVAHRKKGGKAAPGSSPAGAQKVKLKVDAFRSLESEEREADKKSIVQVRRSIAFLAVVMVGYFLFLVFSGQFDEFLRSLARVDETWIYRGALCYVLYYALGVSAYVFSVVADPKSPVGLRDLMSVEASGIFFMNLTPNGMGAAPAQIYRLTRSGLSIGGASALQSTRFIIYEAGEGIFAAIMLVFRLDYFLENFDNVVFIGALLFGFKIVEVVVLLIVCLYPRFVTRLAVAGVSFVGRRGWLKGYEEKRDALVEQINEFALGFRAASKHVPDMIAILVLTLAQLACLYALPWFVLQAFGKEADLITCMASGSMLELLTSAIPLPGGTGGAEGGFALLFGKMFQGEVAAGFVLWRAIEYFLPTLAAAPLLGLRSRSDQSLHQRWGQIRRRLLRFRPHRPGRGSKGGGASDGIKVKIKRR